MGNNFLYKQVTIHNKMRRLLTIISFLTIGQNSFATDWLSYYIYIQTDYLQGPWTRTDILDKSGSYKYLHPKQFEELFGTEREDLANAILTHLQKETPDRYKFKCTLLLSSDTVIIQTKDTITDFDAIKNELTASFTLNNFIAVKLIQRNQTTLFQLKDITVPYMDLVFPTQNTSQPLQRQDTLTTSQQTEALTNGQTENKISIWLIISIVINLVLTIMLIRQRK